MSDIGFVCRHCGKDAERLFSCCEGCATELAVICARLAVAEAVVKAARIAHPGDTYDCWECGLVRKYDEIANPPRADEHKGESNER